MKDVEVPRDPWLTPAGSLQQPVRIWLQQILDSILVPSVKAFFYDTAGAGTHTWSDGAVGAWVTLKAGGGSGGGKANGANIAGAGGGGEGEEFGPFWFPRPAGAATTPFVVGAGGVSTSGTAIGQPGGDTTWNGVMRAIGGRGSTAGTNGGNGGVLPPYVAALAGNPGASFPVAGSAIRPTSKPGCGAGDGGSAAIQNGRASGVSVVGAPAGAGGTNDGVNSGGGAGAPGYAAGVNGANASSNNGIDATGYGGGGSGCSGGPAGTPLKGGDGYRGFIAGHEVFA